MFDLRYHVTSLAAVFIALVIGILVGVALAHRGLNESDRLRFERDLRDARARIDQLEQDKTALGDTNRAGKRFLESAYSAVMTDRLQGRRIAVLFIGSIDPKLRGAISRTLEDSGGTMLRLRAITVPIKTDSIVSTLRKRKQLASFARPGHLDDVGRELADEFVVGGDTPLWDALEQMLVEERSGGGRQPADGVVIARTAAPQKSGTSAFLAGLLDKLADRSVPVVGAELTRSRPSWVPAYERRGMSSVDNADRPEGRVSLAVVLSGAVSGHYGTRDDDDELVPEVPPLPVATVPTGG